MVIAVRPASSDDAEAIAAIYAPYVAEGAISFELDPPSADDMAGRMAKSDGWYPWLVLAEDGAVVGYAYATRFRDRPAYRYAVETSVYLVPDARGKGYGRQLYDALIDTVRAQGFTHAVGAIALPNDWSIRLHESVGFRRAGVYREIGFKQGRWIDVGIWQCELNDATIPPLEPKPFRDVGMKWDW